MSTKSLIIYNNTMSIKISRINEVCQLYLPDRLQDEGGRAEAKFALWRVHHTCMFAGMENYSLESLSFHP